MSNISKASEKIRERLPTLWSLRFRCSQKVTSQGYMNNYAFHFPVQLGQWKHKAVLRLEIATVVGQWKRCVWYLLPVFQTFNNFKGWYSYRLYPLQLVRNYNWNSQTSWAVMSGCIWWYCTAKPINWAIIEQPVDLNVRCMERFLYLCILKL